ncbi:MAG: TetR/AcrR family transcriptional regulator [Clostridia bacterium]|nr:TetR/AcrR family transcriptional regulator [Clostridia bacterium]
MPPKVKVTKEDIIKTTLSLVREQGDAALNARNIANALGCSTQPIFSNFSTMDALRQAVIDEARKLFGDYINREVESGIYPTPYKASGMAYIRFA